MVVMITQAFVCHKWQGLSVLGLHRVQYVLIMVNLKGASVATAGTVGAEALATWPVEGIDSELCDECEECADDAQEDDAPHGA